MARIMSMLALVAMAVGTASAASKVRRVQQAPRLADDAHARCVSHPFRV
jgi:hypothetical protein